MTKNKEHIDKNIAFIDAQNLYLGTTSADEPWVLDLKRFRIYLTQKYDVKKAYYFIGNYDESLQELYDFLNESGFILQFREHAATMLSKKRVMLTQT